MHGGYRFAGLRVEQHQLAHVAASVEAVSDQDAVILAGVRRVGAGTRDEGHFADQQLGSSGATVLDPVS